MKNTNFKIPDDISHQCIDGEVIAINLERGVYHSMRGTAAVIWIALTEGLDFPAIAGRFQNPAEEIESPLAAFLSALQSAGLLAEGRTAEPAPATLPVKTLWEPPVLETFDDLSQLLMADPIHDVGESAWPELEQPKPKA